jgi:tRNA-dihydrouridine synthase
VKKQQPNFWKAISKPVLSLAPMEDVTDSPFREIVLKVTEPGRLHVLYTEFTSTDGLSHPIGRDKVSHRLFVSDSERQLLKAKGVRIVAQIWGSKPEKFADAARFIEENYQFDGIDINMGCPVKKIVKQGACSALIGQPALAAEIFRATRESCNLPISIKTRTGLKKHETERWISQLLLLQPDALILHARTQKDESKVAADWEQFHTAAQLRKDISPETALLGNGDIFSLKDADLVCEKYGLDGAMIGRGIFHNPWMFSELGQAGSPEAMLSLLWDHACTFHRIWAGNKNFNILKRFFKIYVHGYLGAHELRNALMETKSLEDVRLLLLSKGFSPL